MPTVPQSIFTVKFNSKDITEDISGDLISVEYTGNTAGESDEVSITVDDRELKWQNDWYPDKNTTVELSIGYEGLTFNCGVFKIDQIELSGPPDTVSIRGIAAAFDKKLRTKNNYAHEGKTLKEIVNTVAQSLGYTVEGNISSIKFDRVTQSNETDISFLRRLADMYGYYFSVRGTVIIFTPETEIDGKEPVLEIDRLDCSGYSFTNKSAGTHKSAKVNHRNPSTGEDIEGSADWGSMVDELLPPQLGGVTKFLKNNAQTSVQGSPARKTVRAAQAPEYREKIIDTEPESADVLKDTGEDELRLIVKAENTQQAEVMAKAALYKGNKATSDVSVTVAGNPMLVEGNTVMLSGFGKFSGKYTISRAVHTKTRTGGYTCRLNMQRVAVTVKGRYKSVKKSAIDTAAKGDIRRASTGGAAAVGGAGF